MGVCRRNHQDPTNRCRVISYKLFPHCKCQSINSRLNSSVSELDHLWDRSHPDLGPVSCTEICVPFKPYPPELQCIQVKLSSFVNFNSKYWFWDLDTSPIFASQFHVINGVQTKHASVTWAALIWTRLSEVTFCHSNTWGSSILLNNQSPYRHLK